MNDFATRTFQPKRVFGYTAPDKMKEIPLPIQKPKKSDSLKHTKEFQFVVDTVCRFSTKRPKEYLQTTTESLLMAHLKRCIDKEQEKLDKIIEEKHLDEYRALYEELDQYRQKHEEVLQQNQQLKATYQNVNSLFSRLCYETDENVLSKLRMDSEQNEEEYNRQLSLYKTQKEALQQREKRTLLLTMNQSLYQLNKKQIEANQKDIDEMDQKSKERIERDKQLLFELSEKKVEYQNILIKKFNANHEDVTVKMRDIIEWLKENDPIVMSNEFYDDQKLKNRPKSIYKILDDEDLEPKEHIMDQIPKLPKYDIDV